MPHLVFVESSFPSYLSQYSDGDLFIYSKKASRYSRAGQKILIVPNFSMRYLKLFFAILRFTCTYQGGFSKLLYFFSKKKYIISDGILSEWLYANGYIKAEKFISIDHILPDFNVQENKTVILGGNFYEFGILSLFRYKKYLKLLRERFPQAYYFPHPKETSQLPNEIFDNKLILTSDNIEIYCEKNGIPQNLIGFLGSTAMASLGKLANSAITIEPVRFNANDCDGPLGNLTDPELLKKSNIRVDLDILEDTVFNMLVNVPNVTLKDIITLNLC
jgi:hypothetical protein